MELPKVTLLRDEWSVYQLIVGKRVYNFTGGKPTPVPVPIALLLGRKRNEKGEPVFKVEALPKIVPAVSAPKEEEVPKKAETPDAVIMQNELGKIPQLRFEGWSLNAQ